MPGGTIQAEGHVQLGSGTVLTVAIIGGTGVYAGARGTFTSREIGGPESDASSDTIRLLP